MHNQPVCTCKAIKNKYIVSRDTYLCTYGLWESAAKWAFIVKAAVTTENQYDINNPPL